MPVTGADQLIHLTTRIDTQSGTMSGSGTGFFLVFEANGGRVPVIVTNKHVVEGADLGWLTLNIAGPDGEPSGSPPERIGIADFASKWTPHPDPQVDLTIAPFGPIAHHLAAQGKPPYFKAFLPSMIATQAELDRLTALENVVMIGYPTGLWDSINNRPIIRRGITATPAFDKFEGRSEFMIDCACFPGSSGSPVVIYDHMHVDKLGNTSVTERLILLGVLFAGPQWTAEGDIVTKTIPTHKTKQVTETPIMINLGYCVRADQILWFEQHVKKHAKS